MLGPWRILVVLGIMVFAFFSGQAAQFYEPVVPPRPFQVMAHRGAMEQAPENTRPALERAIEDQFEWAEVDVRLTKDGHHVIIHDSEVDGKTDGSGRVKDLTLAEIKALDAGSWFGPAYAGLRVLTLPECLDVAKGRINLYLDCKDIDAARLVQEVLAADMGTQVVVFDDLERLASVRSLSNGGAPIMPKWAPEYGRENWLSRWQPDAVEIDAGDITREICEWFHERGVKVQAKVLNEDDRPEVWDRVLDAGVDWLQTDLAEEILAYRLWSKRPKRPVQIAFHRGACRYAPENTLPALEKAVRMGADYVEIDIRASKDGRFFLLHDSTLDRTTDGTGPIDEATADTIRALDAGSWFGKPFRGAKAPAVEEAFEALRGRAHLYVDAKSIPPSDLARLLDSFDLVDRSVVYQAPQYLRELKKINPAIRALCPLFDPNRIEHFAETVQPYGFDVSWDILSEELIARCHALGIQVFSDAIGEHERIEDYRRAVEWGIDVIQTDFPLRVIRAVETLEGNPEAERLITGG